MASDGSNPYVSLLKTLEVKGKTYKYFDLPGLKDPRYDRLPFSIRILLEAAIRNCDNFHILKSDVENILNWEIHQHDVHGVEVSFKPARVILQDFTGVPAVVDFAAMRDAVQTLGGDPERINPVCPSDLVIDHSVQVDFTRSVPYIIPNPCADACGRDCPQRGRDPPNVSRDGIGLNQTRDPNLGAKENQNNALALAKNRLHSDHSGGQSNRQEKCPFHHLNLECSGALQKNQDMEFERNKERFLFLKWGARAFKNMLIVPPGSGIVHQVNLEYLARVVFNVDGLLYPDSLVGTDSHTTMINGLGIIGWGVGGIEAEAVMLGQAISMVLPKVVGYKLVGHLGAYTTSTDVVLTITKHLRQLGVVGKFVEFFGPGVSELSIADRATISNMCPEYGATIGFFPVDAESMTYLQQTGREEVKMAYIEAYLKAMKLFRNYNDATQDPLFSEVVELDLNTVVSSMSGPKRPHDRVPISDMKRDFTSCLISKIGFKGFGIDEDKLQTTIPFVFDNKEYLLRNGSVVIAAITSCTNTSNPSVMLGAGLLAKKAVERGLTVAPFIKTSLSPGSGVVTYYLQASGVTPFLQALGFDIVGYGCMTCIGNSGPLPDPVVEAIDKGNLVAVGVLSGNRNFEGRIHPNTRANYLASPPLVIAYAIAGRVDIDLDKEPMGLDSKGKPVYLQDLWPTREEIQEVERKYVIPAMFKEVYSKIEHGSSSWNALVAPDSMLYPWDRESTYIKSPPFFQNMTRELSEFKPIEKAFVLLNLGDSVTTDHISPAGSIARNSCAARYLMSRGLTPREFNSYGARRGNDAVMVRGTFANIRLVNKFIGKAGPKTIHIPTGEEMDIYDAAVQYHSANHPLIVLAGKDYGSGSSRDWAAKGPFLLGISAVIAESYERIHRSNLVGMGIVPLEFRKGETAETYGLTGRENYSIDITDVKPGKEIFVEVSDGRKFPVTVRFDTEVELEYYRHGGILNYMIRKMLQ